jgi:hypothetical protein
MEAWGGKKMFTDSAKDKGGAAKVAVYIADAEADQRDAVIVTNSFARINSEGLK